MSFVNSPNMRLPVPSVGSESGPQYAIDVNNCFAIVDQHDHSAGSGVQITPAGININTALTFNGNFATALSGATLQAQAVTPANGTVYSNASGFLFYTDLNTGLPIQITNSSGIVGTPGSISGLVSPASASYVVANNTFVWQSGASAAANLDAASILLRNIIPNSTYAVTLQPPAALSFNYPITLPLPPGSTSLVSMTTAGVLAANVVPDATTIQISEGTLSVVPGGIGNTQLAANAVATVNIQNQAVTTATIQDQAVTRAKLAAAYYLSPSSGTFATSSFTPTFVTNLFISGPFQGTPVMICLVPDFGNIDPTYVGINTGTAQAYIEVRRNGTTLITNTLIQYPGVNSSITPFFMTATDTPPAGTNSYIVNACVREGPGGTVQVLRYRLLVYEL